VAGTRDFEAYRPVSPGEIASHRAVTTVNAQVASNDGAPGIDGVIFAVIEAQGVAAFLEQLRNELVRCTHVPLPARRQAIPKDGGKVRILSIPAIRDRVVQGALKLTLEPIFVASGKVQESGMRTKSETFLRDPEGSTPSR
jgi:RNA-directed DNA polymerase